MSGHKGDAVRALGGTGYNRRQEAPVADYFTHLLMLR